MTINKRIGILILYVIVITFLVGCQLVTPRLENRKNIIFDQLTLLEEAQRYYIDITMTNVINENFFDYVGEIQVAKDLRLASINYDLEYNDNTFRFIEYRNGYLIGYLDHEYNNLETQFIADNNIDQSFNESIDERPENALRTLPWDRAIVLKDGGLRMVLTLSEVINSPFYKRVITKYNIYETKRMPSKFQAIVEVRINYNHKKLIVNANAFDITMRYQEDCTKVGEYNYNVCRIDIDPDSYQSQWIYQINPDLTPTELDENMFRLIPPNDINLIRSYSKVGIDYFTSDMINGRRYQKFWLEPGQYSVTLLKGEFFKQDLFNEDGVSLLPVNGYYDIPTEGTYYFVFIRDEYVKYKIQRNDTP